MVRSFPRIGTSIEIAFYETGFERNQHFSSNHYIRACQSWHIAANHGPRDRNAYGETRHKLTNIRKFVIRNSPKGGIELKKKKRRKLNGTGENWRLDRWPGGSVHSALLLSSRSFWSFKISWSNNRIMSCDFSIEATSVLPSRFHRCTRSYSALRRRNLISIFSQTRHSVFTFSVLLTSFMPHVSPVRYS